MRKVVCAVLRRADGRILLARRASGRHLERHWELPGGKVEQGESLEVALQPELLEELGLLVSVGELFPSGRCYSPNSPEKTRDLRWNRSLSSTSKPLASHRSTVHEPRRSPPSWFVTDRLSIAIRA